MRRKRMNGNGMRITDKSEPVVVVPESIMMAAAISYGLILHWAYS